MLEQTRISESDRPPGILDHLSDAMSLVLEFPRLVMIPVLLDIYLLAGLHISGLSLTSRLGQWFLRRGGENSTVTGNWIRDLESWDGSRLLALLIPGVLDGSGQDQTYQPFDRLIWRPDAIVAAAAGAAMVLIGIALFTAYLTMLASQAGMIRTSPEPILRFLLDRWVKLVGAAMLFILAISIVTAMSIAPSFIFATGGMDMATIVGIVSLIGLALFVVTLFVPEAIVIDGAAPLAAIRASASVVFGSFWQAAAFIAVSLLISPGLLSIWEHIAGDPVGLGIAVVLNAVMVTSLSIASLAFYRARTDGVTTSPRTI